ncbi:Berberine bridge enzyme-like 26 [Vitis vinifera]|uniref:Berberine bridge enzyme-like 26 n=1 Tax=Vitis vinifera TaxID=29760 RepID=A0A438H6D5_VITVI|nr:Berberine bridge enzyme-like 26 [Vitis vinifera]
MTASSNAFHHLSAPSPPISGVFYTPTNSSYAYVLQSYIQNLRFMSSTTPKPSFIVASSHVSHVQATIICCKIHGLQLRIRSGGHDYDGLSYVSDVPFVILDMFNLREVSVDIENEWAWVQSGATMGELYYRIAEKSNLYGFPAGVCPTVGVGGHFSGGGYGNMMRKYGLSVDNVLDAQIVDANGRILDRESMEKISSGPLEEEVELALE